MQYNNILQQYNKRYFEKPYQKLVLRVSPGVPHTSKQWKHEVYGLVLSPVSRCLGPNWPWWNPCTRCWYITWKSFFISFLLFFLDNYLSEWTTCFLPGLHDNMFSVTHNSREHSGWIQLSFVNSLWITTRIWSSAGHSESKRLYNTSHYYRTTESPCAKRRRGQIFSPQLPKRGMLLLLHSTRRTLHALSQMYQKLLSHLQKFCQLGRALGPYLSLG